MTRDLCRDSGDHAIVLHVHEFATGRFGRIQVDCGEGEGEGVVAKTVDCRGESGLTRHRRVNDGDRAGRMVQ
jgi:hypothetical protein